jgi:predicted small lipoprotein YifL
MMPRRAIRLLASLALVLALALTVAACGKRGNPAPPEGTTDTFPKKYPVR